MKWKKILKQDDADWDIEDRVKLTELRDYAEGAASDLAPSAGVPDRLNFELDQLKGYLDDDLFSELDEQVNDIWGKYDELSNDLEMFADTIREHLAKGKQEKEEVDDESIHPDFRNYKLKDDEQWGEGPEGLLVPKPIDEMYGAEW